jgi:hypothetical protein
MKTISKIKDSVFFIPGVIVFAVVVAIYLILGAAVWQNFLGNFLATMLGAIVGIPIAIWLSNKQRHVEDSIQKAKIVPMLREELLVNMAHLSSWEKSNFQKMEIVYTGIFLEDDAWDALSASGQLAFIRDVNLLLKLGHAYNSIRIVKQLSERYMALIHLADQQERELLLGVVGPLLGKGIGVAIEDIRAAFLAI